MIAGVWAMWSRVALATPAFDPTVPDVRFEGPETFTQPEDVRLWNAVERWIDPDDTLFAQEGFNDGLTWRDTDFTPWIATAFGDATPPSGAFLLHVGLREATATGTPILMVHGAGDNGSRGFVTLATRLDRTDRPVYALTFPHPHGDVLMQAETVANAVAVIRERTGSPTVDLVGHSKGGIAAAVYVSHHAGADWGRPDYAAVGTPYRGDVRRLLLIATPLGGVDTSYRWSGLNLYSLDVDQAISPSAWDRYYPASTLFPLVFDDLSDADFLPDGADWFPGQRQILRRQAPPLPGSQLWMGIYALQPDWYTTYEGGLGLNSRSDGIDAAIDAGGTLLDHLAETGVDPGVEIFLLAGSSVLLPNGDDALADQFALLGGLVDYPSFVSTLAGRGIGAGADPDELSGLEGGQVVLGEISGPSDGLVFVDSALQTFALVARGAKVVETRVVDLSHLDLLYASPITGALLEDLADEGDPDDQWMRSFGRRYTEADTLGWIEAVLADPIVTAPSIPTGDTASPATTGPPDDPPADYRRPCGSCSAPGTPPTPWAGAVLWLVLGRRRGRPTRVAGRRP